MRFIPTGVGNTGCHETGQRSAPVHPHRRGEHNASLSEGDAAAGSSPQAWGTPVLTNGVKPIVRFIPTGVGNTVAPLECSMGTPVHPHRRGEHFFAATQESASRRFIPTGVGNTAHQINAQIERFGSSPQAWGTHA